MFRIIEVDLRRSEVLETLGTKRKFWYANKERRRVLFKAEERGTGEDWAEKIACELCRLLGLPHVHYELAVQKPEKIPGVACETCAPPPSSLVLGNQLLLQRDPSYPIDEKRKYKVREHTVEAVAEVVRSLAMPPAQWLKALPDGITTALDVFVGYVMLDAWIANQDRHHENWAAVKDNDRLWLAPSFDHGASMARNLSDSERKDRLESQDAGRQIPQFARRASSAFYADATASKPMKTVEAWRAFSLFSPEAAAIWVERLRAIDENTLENVLSEVPPHRLSPIGRHFTRQLLVENRRRILEGEET